jgi:hypothetical protein
MRAVGKPVIAWHPELVDISLLPPKGTKIVGAGGRMEPQDSTADFGKLIFEQAAYKIIGETLHRLNNIGMYKGHGNSLNEGMWK